MKMNVVGDTEWAQGFLDKYEELEVLWNKNSKDYVNRTLRNTAWNKLLEEFRKAKPAATLTEVKKRVNCMRTCYAREFKKVRNSKRAAAGRKDHQVYVPSLWYFEKLSFLETMYSPRASPDRSIKRTWSVDDLTDSQACEIFYSPVPETNPKKKPKVHKKERSFSSEVEFEVEEEPRQQTSSPVRQLTPSLVRQLTPSPVRQQSLQQSYHQKQQQQQQRSRPTLDPLSTSTQQRDTAAIYGEAWIAGFREMQPVQQLYAKKAIDDIINAGLQGQLNPSTFEMFQLSSAPLVIPIKSTDRQQSPTYSGSSAFTEVHLSSDEHF